MIYNKILNWLNDTLFDTICYWMWKNNAITLSNLQKQSQLHYLWPILMLLLSVQLQYIWPYLSLQDLIRKSQLHYIYPFLPNCKEMCIFNNQLQYNWLSLLQTWMTEGQMHYIWSFSSQKKSILQRKINCNSFDPLCS